MQAVSTMGVIGAGAWGTALAKHLAEKGMTVRLWAYEHDVAQAIMPGTKTRRFFPA